MDPLALLPWILGPLGATVSGALVWSHWQNHKEDSAARQTLYAALQQRPGARPLVSDRDAIRFGRPEERTVTVRPEQIGHRNPPLEAWSIVYDGVRGDATAKVAPRLRDFNEIPETGPLDVVGGDRALARAIGQDTAFEAAVLAFSRARDAYEVSFDGAGSVSVKCDRRGYSTADLDSVLVLVEGIIDAYEAAVPRAEQTLELEERAARLALSAPKGGVSGGSGAPVAFGSSTDFGDGR